MKIRFVNFELGFGSSVTLMQGWTHGAFGPPSRYSAEFGGQVVELEVKDEVEYLKIIKELKNAYHMPLRRWVPVPDFAEMAAAVPKWDEQERASYLARSRAPNPPEPVAPTMHHSKLGRIARAENIDLAGCRTRAEMAEAIIAARAGKSELVGA